MAIGKTSWQIPTAVIALALGYLASGATLAQENKGEIPKPKTVSLTTKDGMALKATYYGSNRRKEAVPVILLHDFKGNRHELHGLARWLQKDLGHAVMVPDLRGHGDSKQLKILGSEKTVELNPEKLRKPDFVNMIFHDMEAVRKFLVGENDKGNLNLNQVCVVGAGMGASVALNWSSERT